MNLADLRIFKAVVDCGSVTKAAAQVHRVQSNLTARIQHLESDLGRKLFDRCGRRMLLTAEGRALYASADRLLVLADEIRREMAEERVAGVVRIGSMESTTATRLPAVLACFHQRHAQAKVDLSTGTSRDLIERVARGDIDIAFVAGEVRGESLAAVAAFREELVLVLPRAGANADLAEIDLVGFKSGCAYRAIGENWLREMGGMRRRVIELGSYHGILACVAAGVGGAIVPRSLLDIYPQRGLLKVRKLPPALGAQPTWMVTRRLSPSPSVAAFRDLVLEPAASARRAPARAKAQAAPAA